MQQYSAPLKDMQFLLHHVFAVSKFWEGNQHFQEIVDGSTADALLDEAGKLIGGVISPLNRTGDEQGVEWSPNGVKTPAGFPEAFKLFAEGGWSALCGNPEFGGMGMPKSISVFIDEMLYGANSSFALYPALTSGACMAIDAHASESLKNTYLPKLYSGEWSGTMCLTEPHAGSDLGLIRTKAVPTASGSFAITGTKIFITGGDHDLSENIVHLVLAKLPDAPEGSRGISLFLVPKYKVSEDGVVGEQNGVSCGSIEHKMGIKASATCVMNFDAAEGFLVGELNRGLQCMFTMMNCERLSIGVQGIGCSEMSYQNAVAYAKDRLQGRDANSTERRPADPIIVHPDVRRMLLTMRSTIEGGRAFALYMGHQLDLSKHAESEAERARANALVALLTPVAKAFFTDIGLENTVLGQQVFGGHGYIREWGQEQLVRDVRIAQIYEGTNGIQALDLIQRKVFSNRGEFLWIFIDEIENFVSEMKADKLMMLRSSYISLLAQFKAVTEMLIAQGERSQDELGAAASEYLHVLGYITYGYMWLRMMEAAESMPVGDAYYQTKYETGRFYFTRVLPRVSSLIEMIAAGAEDLMSPSAASF